MDRLRQCLGLQKPSTETQIKVHINEPAMNGHFTGNKIKNTKYNVLTFLPLNLYIQFGRFMNIYFIAIALLQLNGNLAPVSPLTIWLPLAFIFALSAVKEGLDDYARFKQDKIANTRQYVVLRRQISDTEGVVKDEFGEFATESQNIRVGDFIVLYVCS
jgi:phospholipid-translocating ATPase